MSWLTEGPMSGLWGRNSSGDEPSRAQQWARYGAAGGPLGMAAGALGGWLADRSANANMASLSTSMPAGVSARVGQNTNWGLKPGSPLAQFGNEPSPGQADPATAPASAGAGAGGSGGGGGGMSGNYFTGGNNWGGGTGGAMLSNLGMAGSVTGFGGWGSTPTGLNNLNMADISII